MDTARLRRALSQVQHNGLSTVCLPAAAATVYYNMPPWAKQQRLTLNPAIPLRACWLTLHDARTAVEVLGKKAMHV